MAAVAACHETAAEQPKYPAFPFALPVLIDSNGPKMTGPNLVVFVAPNDPHKPEVVAVLDYLRSSDYWAATTAEYGIGPIGSVTAQDPPAPFPDKLTRKDVANIVASFARDSRFGGDAGALGDGGSFDAGAFFPGTHHTDTLYVVVIPPSTTLSDTDCDIGGFHDYVYATTTDQVPYSVARGDCPGPSAPTLSVSLVHEIVEAATDPFFQADPGVYDTDNLAWTAANADEVADLCAGLPAQFDTNPPVLVQGTSSVVLAFPSVWSNRLAKLGVDPCVPKSATSPRVFAAAFPDTPDTIAINSALDGPGVNVAIDDGATISLKIASDRPTKEIGVTVGDMAPILGGSGTELLAQLSSPTAKNGDVLKLMVSRRAPPSIPGLSASVLAIRTTADDGGTSFTSYLVIGGPRN